MTIGDSLSDSSPGGGLLAPLHDERAVGVAEGLGGGLGDEERVHPTLEVGRDSDLGARLPHGPAAPPRGRRREAAQVGAASVHKGVALAGVAVQVAQELQPGRLRRWRRKGCVFGTKMPSLQGCQDSLTPPLPTSRNRLALTSGPVMALSNSARAANVSGCKSLLGAAQVRLRSMPASEHR